MVLGTQFWKDFGCLSISVVGKVRPNFDLEQADNGRFWDVFWISVLEGFLPHAPFLPPAALWHPRARNFDDFGPPGWLLRKMQKTFPRRNTPGSILARRHVPDGVPKSYLGGWRVAVWLAFLAGGWLALAGLGAWLVGLPGWMAGLDWRIMGWLGVAGLWLAWLA